MKFHDRAWSLSPSAVFGLSVAVRLGAVPELVRVYDSWNLQENGSPKHGAPFDVALELTNVPESAVPFLRTAAWVRYVKDPRRFALFLVATGA